MRHDMYKVIVERPRSGGGSEFKSEARKYRNSEETAAKIGMKKGHKRRKGLNENLSPLKHFLKSQVGRPWNKVYSELSNGIDRRNTVQAHIYAHIEQFVATKTEWLEPEDKAARRHLNNGDCVIVKGQGWRAAWLPLRQSSSDLYVHPCSGLLLKNSYYERERAKRKRQVSQCEIAAIKKAQQLAGLFCLTLHFPSSLELDFN